MKTIAEQIQDIIQEQLGVNPAQIVPEARFIEDLGMDSLDTVELVMAFEGEFEIELRDEDAERVETVGQAIALTEAIKAATWHSGDPIPEPRIPDMLTTITATTEAARRAVTPDFPRSEHSPIPISPQAVKRYHITNAVIDEIAHERARQIQEEGYTPEIDDAVYQGGTSGELAFAAASYAKCAALELQGRDGKQMPATWPWSAECWKPCAPRRALVKAAALLIAQIEQIDRANAPQVISGDIPPAIAAHVAAMPENRALMESDPEYLERLKKLGPPPDHESDQHHGQPLGGA